MPTSGPQGVEGRDARTGTPRWNWARRLKWVLDLDRATWPLWRCGSLLILAALTQEAVLSGILGHVKRAAVPPMAPTRSRHALGDWVSSAHARPHGLVGDVCATTVSLVSGRHL